MNSADWAKLKDWFGAALESPDRVPELLQRAERESPDLAAELAALLREHVSQDLRTRAVLDQAPTAVEAHPIEGPAGGTVGPYRILRELGRGGTGVVFLAERSDDEFHRPVALKVLRYVAWDKRGRELLTQERRVLSQLQHANIAALLDWGETPDGAPWLVTEYVEGQPVDQYCRAHGLGVPDTLTLFTQVCEAVQYAHRRLVVHRDLKPANILVTEAGVVKLLDFGISKPMDEASATATTERRFTPAYASPEQIQGAQVTALSDVFSLGLVLYELLAGALPHATGSLEDMVRRLEDRELPPPSVTPGLARERHRALRGDLDAIVLHALERNPERRYPSVEQFLADLERYLAGFPIAARRSTAVSRAAKFVRRHAVPVTLAVFAVVALVAGAAIAIWNARVAIREKQVAEKRFDDVRNLAHWVMFDVHDMIRRLPGERAVQVRRSLLVKSQEYLNRLNAEHTTDDGLLKEVGFGYIRIGYGLGGLAGTNLGNTPASIAAYRAALTIFDDLWQRHPDDEWVGACRFACVYNLCMMMNDPAEGAALAGRYAPDVELWRARDPNSPPLQAAELVHAGLGRTRRALGALDDALKEFDISVEASRRAFPMTHTDNTPRPMFGTWLDRSQNYFDTGLAIFARTETLLEMGRTADAAASALEARAWFERAVAAGPEGPQGPSDLRMAARVRGLAAQALWELHDPKRLDAAWAEARVEMTAALANVADGNVTSQRDLAEAHRHMGNILSARGDATGGLDHLQHAVTVIGTLATDDPTFLMNRYLLAGMLNDYGLALLGAKQAAAASRALARALDTATQGMREAPSWVELVRERARAESGLGRAAVAGAGHMTPAARDQLQRAMADWQELRRRSPLNRRYLDEQHIVEILVEKEREP